MTRILRQPAVVESTPRALGGSDLAADPAVRALLDQTAAAAYERGKREGFDAGQREVAAALQQVAGGLHTAIEQVLAARREDADHIIELALRIAEVVTGQTPDEGSRALIDRVHQALATLDDTPLVARCHPDEAQVLQAGLVDVADITVEPDPTMRPGEARIRGAWADADLTWPTIWQTIEEALRGDA